MERSKTAMLHERIETRKSKLAEIKQKLKNKRGSTAHGTVLLLFGSRWEGVNLPIISRCLVGVSLMFCDCTLFGNHIMEMTILYQ